MALVLAEGPKPEDEAHARPALAMSIDTAAINNVVLQGGGAPTGTMLPNWETGYAFAFPIHGGAENVRQERIQGHRPPAFTLGYEASDPTLRLIAERILLNARDVGITLQLASTGAVNLHLLRTPLSSSEPHVAMTELAKALQLPDPKFSNSSVTPLYSAETSLLPTPPVLPLIHL